MRFLFVIWFCLLPFSLHAQSSDPDEAEKGVLTRWLETNLSGAGREVRIEGFAGALSSTATLDKLTVADDKGIWITIENATLDWSRSALLRGNLEVEELTAQSIDLVRWPETDPSTPSPEASEFKLPELPVAVQIKNVAADSLTLGELILGEAAVVSLSGQLELVSGQGTADIAIDRIDDKAGSLGLKADYNNTTSMLNLALQVVEEEDGILVNLLSVPDRPSVDFEIEGSGPTSDFLARVALETNGAPRITGEIQLLAVTDPNGAVTNTPSNGAFRRYRDTIGRKIPGVCGPGLGTETGRGSAA